MICGVIALLLLTALFFQTNDAISKKTTDTSMLKRRASTKKNSIQSGYGEFTDTRDRFRKNRATSSRSREISELSELDQIRKRWTSIREAMKKSEALRAEYIGEWEEKHGFRSSFLIPSPSIEEKTQWGKLMSLTKPPSKRLDLADELYEEDAKSKFYFAKNMNYRLVSLTTYTNQENPEKSYIQITENYVKTREDVVYPGEQDPDVYFDLHGGSIQKIYLNEMSEDWHTQSCWNWNLKNK